MRRASASAPHQHRPAARRAAARGRAGWWARARSGEPSASRGARRSAPAVVCAQRERCIQRQHARLQLGAGQVEEPDRAAAPAPGTHAPAGQGRPRTRSADSGAADLERLVGKHALARAADRSRNRTQLVVHGESRIDPRRARVARKRPWLAAQCATERATAGRAAEPPAQCRSAPSGARGSCETRCARTGQQRTTPGRPERKPERSEHEAPRQHDRQPPNYPACHAFGVHNSNSRSNFTANFEPRSKLCRGPRNLPRTAEHAQRGSNRYVFTAP